MSEPTIQIQGPLLKVLGAAGTVVLLLLGGNQGYELAKSTGVVKSAGPPVSQGSAENQARWERRGQVIDETPETHKAIANAVTGLGTSLHGALQEMQETQRAVERVQQELQRVGNDIREHDRDMRRRSP